MRRVPRFVCTEDVKIAAWFGVIEAVDRYDATKQVKLKTYVNRLVRGRILDHLRGLMMLHGARRRGIANTIEILSLNGNDCGSYESDFSGMEAAHDLDLLLSKTDLTGQERMAFDLYRRDMPYLRAAVKMKVHPSRVSQLRAKTISKMRTAAEIDPSLLHPGY